MLSKDKNKREQLPISLIDIVLLFVVSVTFSSIILLISNRFNSLHALLIGIVLTILFLKFFNIKFVLRDNRFSIFFLFIILISLLFRSEPYLYIMGGQDEGIYVNMSATYERTGSTFIVDHLRDGLDDEGKKTYDDVNHGISIIKKNRYEGVHLPGIYIKDLNRSLYVFQFYPINPIWMAIVAKIFGSDNRVYSLVFFSLISIISFYLLAYEISGKKRLPGHLIALFLAVSPLHAFFSKFPVSEVVALAFTSSSFYCLVKYYKENINGKINTFYLFLSSALMFCFFLTRISGFMYIPFFYVLMCITLMFCKNSKLKKHLIIYYFSILILFICSLLYGYFYSFPYFYNTYKNVFLYISPDHWLLILVIIFVFMTTLLVISSFKDCWIKNILKKIFLAINKSLPYIFFIVVLIGIYRAYEIGFTDKYIGDNWIDNRWHAVNLGWESFKFSNIFVAITYISPVGFIILIFAIYNIRKSKNIFHILLLLFLIIFWTFGVVIRLITPYQYYYARYFLSELVPYSFLLIALYFGYLFEKSKIQKHLVKILAIAVTIYSMYFSFYQFLGKEAEGAKESLNKIQNRMDEKDMLLINKKEALRMYGIKTPLSYYFGLNVMNIEDIQKISKKLYKTLITEYNDVYILSQSPHIKNPYLRLIDIISYKQGRFEHTNTIPKKFEYIKTDLYLFKIDKYELYYKYIVPTSRYIYGILQNFYNDNIWTNGEGIINNIGYVIQPNDEFLVLHTKGWNPYKNDLQKLKLKIFVNGSELNYMKKENNSYYFSLKSEIKTIEEIRIKSSTFVPYKLNIGEDHRELGIDVDFIVIE